MKVLVAPLAFAGLAALAAGTAQAASPAYCALYAREYANQMLEVGAPAGMTVDVQDQAYYRCLNQDEDPVLPTASAYFGTDIVDLGGIDQPFSEGDAAEEDPTPVEVKPKVQKVAAAASRPSRNSRSGFEAWTPEWRDWCEDHFPRSFNPETGLVKPYKTNKWTFC